MYIRLLLLLLLLSTNICFASEIKKQKIIELNTLKAFPTAQGAGADASGGRGGKVIYVVNKSKDRNQTGSLNYALSQKGKRTIVFAIGGEFKQTENRRFNVKGNLTIAGQTANKFGGVHLTTQEGSKNSYYAFRDENFIIRYITARGRWKNFYNYGKKGALLDMQTSNNAIVDHFTGGWGTYCLGFNKYNKRNNKAGQFTLQRSLCIENIGISSLVSKKMGKGHNVSLVTGVPMSNANSNFTAQNIDKQWNNMKGKWDFHHNAFILNHHRQPTNTSGGAKSQFALTSNYTYGWGSRLARHGGNAQLDMINNLFEKGNYGKELRKSNLFKLSFSVRLNSANTNSLYTPSIYVVGNKIVDHKGKEFLHPNKQFEQSYTSYCHKKEGCIQKETNDSNLSLYLRTTMQSIQKFPVSLTPAKNVKENVLQNVGAGVRFNSNGSMATNDDSIDSKYINYAINKTGPSFISKKLNDKGVGDPMRFVKNDYKQIKAKNLDKWDSDRDGMPNIWEVKHKLNPNKANNNNITTKWSIDNYLILNNAGYTDLEIYLADMAGDFHLLAK